MIAGSGSVRARQGLIGRSDVVAAIVAGLRSEETLGALVVADPGLGKTALVDAVLDQLGAALRPLRIPTSRALTAVPFGALAPFLGSLPHEDSGSPWAVVRALQDCLESGNGEVDDGSRVPSLLVIDDAHDLDPDSAKAVAQLVATESVRLLVLSRPRPAPPREFVSLWTDGLLGRFDLGPLNQAQCHELCRQVLGGAVLATSTALLHKSSGGNPLFLLGQLDQGRRLGRIVRSGTVWLLTDHHPAIDPLLLDRVREQLQRRSEAEIEVLETVALAEPLSLSVLLRTSAVEAIDALEEAHLITVSEAPDRRVALAHPLYGEVLRRLVPAGRSLAIRQCMTGLLDAELLSGPALLRFVAWSLDCGMPVSELALLHAVREANRTFQFDLALRAAALLGAGQRPAACVEMAYAYYYLGAWGQASMVLAEVIELATEPATIAAAALLGLRLGRRAGRDAEDLRATSAAWLAGAERRSADGQERAAAAAQAAGRLLQLQVLIEEGQHRIAEDELRRMAKDAADDGFRVLALTVLGEVYAAVGSCESAAEVTSTARRLLRDGTRPGVVEDEHVLFDHAFSLWQAGNWEGLAECLATYVAPVPAGLTYFGGTVHLLEALVAFRQGLMREALAGLETAIEALQHSDPGRLLPFAVAQAAYAAYLLGEREPVERYSVLFRDLPPGSRGHLHLLGQAYVFAAGAGVHGVTLTLQQLAAVTAAARSSGLRAAEVDMLLLGIRLGDQGGWLRLVELTEDLEGVYAHLLNDYAHGVLDRDPGALLRVSDAASAAGYRLLSAECAGHALRFLQGGGDRRDLRSASQLLQQRRVGLEGIAVAGLETPRESTSLTRRERDIATLVLNGESNRQVAERLSLSLRTVEGHLYRIFGKLGINRREELTAVHLGTLQSVR